MKFLIFLLFPLFSFAQKPDKTEAFTISKNFVDDYVNDVSYEFLPKPNVTITGNGYTVICKFIVDNVKYNYECTMAYLGGEWSYKSHWKLLSFYIEGKEFYFDENYKKYIKH